MDLPQRDGCTPLYGAAYWRHLEVVRLWIASGREMDPGEPGNEAGDVVLVGKRRREELGVLLERFRANPAQTRGEVRRELGLFDDGAGEIFALVIFLCDGLLAISEGDGNANAKGNANANAKGKGKEKGKGKGTTAGNDDDGDDGDDTFGAARFFRIVRELPMDLQVVMCHRAVGSMGTSIPGDQRERVFRQLATIILVQG